MIQINKPLHPEQIAWMPSVCVGHPPVWDNSKCHVQDLCGKYQSSLRGEINGILCTATDRASLERAALRCTRVFYALQEWWDPTDIYEHGTG